MQNQSLNPALTPLMQQYWDIKSAHQDKIVLFRMGDFFEMFFHDAETAAPILGIALTSRNKNSPQQTPMCGVPAHSIASNINKLLAAGFRVAICDQIEDPKNAKGLVKRAVTRILSPGVIYDPDTIAGQAANYLTSFDSETLSFLDTTTGEAFYFMVKDQIRRERLMQNLRPVELVVEAGAEPSVDRASHEILCSIHNGIFSDESSGPVSARRLLSYVVSMQGEKILATLQPFQPRDLTSRMELTATAVRHLEIFSTYRGEAKGSLFHAIDRTRTAMGARRLRNWLTFPLLEVDAINLRLDQVEAWRGMSEARREVREFFKSLGDIERRLAKLGNPSVNPSDLAAISSSLLSALRITETAAMIEWPREGLNAARDLAQLIDRTIVASPPLTLKNGGVVQKGINPELDLLIELSTHAAQHILELEVREREQTGIPSLKIRYNSVFGYYIEITHTHKNKVPLDRYDRKQTLANAERYISKELSELEGKILSAESKRIELEAEIFAELVATALAKSRVLLDFSRKLAELDAITSLAELAIEQSYCRPQLHNDCDLNLKASRHPVIEQVLKSPFVANDIALKRGECLLLTGPNMAGKSTLMRQVACSALLAQVGSFIPAQTAELPIFDQIFTRIGASDFLTEGLSTFMVEMQETAAMLRQSSEKSLVILDEIGRGTSTYDGFSLAQAILEFLLEKRGCMTLFATHYHELTELNSTYPQLQNAHMRIHEKSHGETGAITFLHQLAKGPANKSYGIHVAKLAGLPETLIKRAGVILRRLESERALDTKQLSFGELLAKQTDSTIQIQTDAPRPQDELIEELLALDLSGVTPLAALNTIAEWQRRLS